jgi:hypothetical protein
MGTNLGKDSRRETRSTIIFEVVQEILLICIQYCSVFACRKCPTQVWFSTMLSSSLTAIAGANQSVNIYNFGSNFGANTQHLGLSRDNFS